MFRAMRRDKQLLAAEEAIAVMNRCSHGVLACLGDEDYPYAIPLSYVYLDGKIYFHSATTGHKIDAIMKNPKVSFTVVDRDVPLSEGYTISYRSVVAFGTARVVDGDERAQAFMALVEKYAGDQPDQAKHEKAAGCARGYMFAIDVKHMTGKEALDLVNARRQ